MQHRHGGYYASKTQRGNIVLKKRPLHSVSVKGKRYNIYKSTRPKKEYMVQVNGRLVHFADPNMPEYPGTPRGNNYCARSSGIKGTNDMNSANYWSRKLWSCKGKKSVSKTRFR